MSELDDFMAEGLMVTENVSGSDEFTLAGKTYYGVLNEFEGTEEIELGGVLSSYNATIVCQRPQFRALGSPLARVLKGKVISIESTNYTIQRVANDRVSVTLGLVITH